MLKKYTTPRGRDANEDTPSTVGAVTNIAAFPLAIHAEMGDGQAVKILATGNVPGFSPGYLVIDGDGDSTWVPLTETTVTDPNFLPVAARKTARER